MGNSAVITTEAKKIGVYMHWYGDRDSVEALLQYCRILGVRKPEDSDYGFARLCQVLGNFFNDNDCLSVGIGPLEELDCDNGDNGLYIIKDWEIVGREFFNGSRPAGHDRMELLKGFNEHMPEGTKLTDAWLEKRASETLCSDGEDTYGI